MIYWFVDLKIYYLKYLLTYLSIWTMRKQFNGIENNNTNIAINKYNPGSLEIIPNGTSILLHSVDMLNGLPHSNLLVLFVELVAAIWDVNSNVFNAAILKK